MNRSVYDRYAWPILLVAAILVPLAAWGTIETFRRSNNNISQWLPSHFPETEAYLDFRRTFGADDFAVISWEGCTLDDDRLTELARHLAPPEEERTENDGTQWFAEVKTGPGMAELLMDRLELSREEAVARLQGTLVGPDGKSSCAVVILSEKGNNRLQCYSSSKIHRVSKGTGAYRGKGNRL